MECGNSGVTSSRHGASERWACFPEWLVTTWSFRRKGLRRHKRLPSWRWNRCLPLDDDLWRFGPWMQTGYDFDMISMLRYTFDSALANKSNMSLAVFQLQRIQFINLSDFRFGIRVACVAGDASLQTGWERSSLQYSEADPWKRLRIDSFQYNCCEASCKEKQRYAKIFTSNYKSV